MESQRQHQSKKKQMIQQEQRGELDLGPRRRST
jgi:hypothetical protein